MASGPSPAIEAPHLRGRFEAVPPLDRDVSGPRRSGAARAIALGVLLDGRIQDGWVLESLRQALAVPGVRLAAVALLRGRHRASLASRLHRVLDWLDRWLRCRKEQLFVPADIAAGLAATPFDVDVACHGDGWFPDEAGVAALRRCEVDLWLCFSAHPPRRPLPRVSRLGVWGIETGSCVSATSVWAGAMEVAAGCPVTMSCVVDYADSGNGPLYRTFGATAGNSVRRSRVSLLRKGMSLFRRLLVDLTESEATRLCARPATSAAPTHYPVQRQPTISALARLSGRLVSNVAANRMNSLRGPCQWQLGYYFADSGETGCRFERLRYLVPPKDRAWADPFAVDHQGRSFIFFEEQPFRTRRGRIMAIEVFEDREPAAPEVVLERPYHLSYPFLFEWEGALHMVPETAENETIELYRCEAFPARWTLRKVLLEGVQAYDATLWRDNDRWWMFVNVAEPGADSSDELHLYWSTTPLGPWSAHRGNPVVSDVRCARPAGPLFVRDGSLYRPSQDCSLAYGHSVVINRVDVLGDDAYRETAVQRFMPGWREDILRIHTLGGSRRLRVIDCVVNRGQWF